MDADLLKSLGQLRGVTSQLQDVCSFAEQVVGEVEHMLSKELGLTEEVQVVVANDDAEPAQSEGEKVEVQLVYGAWEKGFRILVTRKANDEEAERKPWADWDRDLRLLTVGALPSLLAALSERMQSALEDALEATAELEQVLPALR